MTCGEMLRREGRQEGELKGRREVRLVIIDGLLREGIEWSLIQSATGIDEPTYRTLKHAARPAVGAALPAGLGGDAAADRAAVRGFARVAGAQRADYYTFMWYLVETGPADTLQALDEEFRRQTPQLRGDLMVCGEMLRREGRQEGELKGRREVRLETIDGLLRAGVKWPVILSATGIDEPTCRTLKRDASHVPEQAAPR